MKLLIDISEYNAEYIKNAYGIPQDINMIIAESIINGKQVPTPHGRLIDADATCNDLATVDPRYETMIDWCIRVIEAQQTVIEAEE